MKDISSFSIPPYNGYAEVDDGEGKWSSYSMIVTSSLPEPSCMLLLGFGLTGLAGVRRFKK